MDKETLSNYGWIVICVLVLAVMLALATPFGTFVADGFKATYTGLFETGDSALDVGLNAVGVKNTLECGHGRKEAGDHSQKECGHYNCKAPDCGCVPASCGVEGHWSGDGKDHTTKVYHNSSTSYKNPHTYACECTNWIVPEGGTYVNSSTTYNSGEVAPCLKSRDKYMYGDYTYTYGLSFGINDYKSPSGWNVDINTDVTDKTKTSYGAILDTIREEPIVSLERTFKGCENLTDDGIPHIPDTVTLMYETFYECKSLVDLSDFSLPNSLEYMDDTFYRCSSLVAMSAIPQNVVNMENVFYYCGKLLNAPDMSKCTKLTSMQYTFAECSQMKTVPDLSNCTQLTNMVGTFRYCINITTPPMIPTSVTNMSGTFYYCSRMTTAPVIPDAVTNLRQTFSYCFELTGEVEINADNLSNYENCFSNTSKSIVLTGDCPLLAEIATTSNTGNVTVQ